ncbi:hypothetical protein BHQ20_06195 [Mycobacterium intermedium]|nr:hypothetical protein BHQ20_06195 [Mycobacterium intermedium]OPE51287.1 hypothetical protein BV508_06915 [Mycobacterium intermedium]
MASAVAFTLGLLLNIFLIIALVIPARRQSRLAGTVQESTQRPTESRPALRLSVDSLDTTLLSGTLMSSL